MFGLGSNFSQALSGNVRSLLCSMLLWGQARQLKGHAPTSTHGELQKNPSKFAELGRLGFARSWLHGTWWAPKGPKQVHSENGLLEMMVDLKRPSSCPLVKLEKVFDLGSSKRAQVFFFQEGPGMNKVEQYGERPFWLNEMRHWEFFKSNTQTRKR